MATSTNNKTPELIARRMRQFTLYYYHALGENDEGRMLYRQSIITRVACDIRRGNARALDGNQSANQNYITIELRDCNVKDFVAPQYERDFCIVCVASEPAPDENITPDDARPRGFNPWSINQVEPVFNMFGRKIQVKLLAN